MPVVRARRKCKTECKCRIYLYLNRGDKTSSVYFFRKFLKRIQRSAENNTNTSIVYSNSKFIRMGVVYVVS